MRWQCPVLILVLVVVACGGSSAPGEPPAPGLEAASEVPVVEVAPDPDAASFEWTSAYQVGDLPKVNVGRPGPEFFADAHRESADVEGWRCIGVPAAVVVTRRTPNSRP